MRCAAKFDHVACKRTHAQMRIPGTNKEDAGEQRLNEADTWDLVLKELQAEKDRMALAMGWIDKRVGAPSQVDAQLILSPTPCTHPCCVLLYYSNSCSHGSLGALRCILNAPTSVQIESVSLCDRVGLRGRLEHYDDHAQLNHTAFGKTYLIRSSTQSDESIPQEPVRYDMSSGHGGIIDFQTAAGGQAPTSMRLFSGTRTFVETEQTPGEKARLVTEMVSLGEPSGRASPTKHPAAHDTTLLVF